MPRVRFADFIPAAVPSLTRATAADAPLLAKWITAGRDEGAFESGPPATLREVRAYQRKMKREADDYECSIVQFDGRPVGYLDLQRRGDEVHILGIYVEPDARRQKLGSHLLRTIAAAARQEGARRVSADVYDDNASSLATFRSAGFRPAATRREASGRGIVAMIRDVPSFERVNRDLPPYPPLSGENIVAHHAAIAEAIGIALGRLEGVTLVLALGSVARGFADRYSDIDLVVIGSGDDLAAIPAGETWVGEINLDVFVIDVEESPFSTWGHDRRQAVEEAVVAFRRRAFHLSRLRNAIRLGAREQRRLLEQRLLELGWIGFHPRSFHGGDHLGYRWTLPPDLWLRRGDEASAHATIDQAVATLIEILYLGTGRLVPDPKWRRFLLRTLAWSPADLERRLQRIDSARRDRRGFEVRAEELLALIEETAGRLREQGLLAGDIYRRYICHSSAYTPGTTGT